MLKSEFTNIEKEILKIVQNQLPNSLTPYKDIADSFNISEQEVLNLLQKLLDDGTIRRFGASIKHQKTIWQFNAMVAWDCPVDRIEEVGAIATNFTNISHCYFRPIPEGTEDWHYNFFTMLHARSEEEVEQTIKTLQEAMQLKDYAVLESIKEYKKSSMVYF